MRVPRRFLLAIVGTAALLSLSGCVYLRLLQVKNQLRSFDAHFAVGGDPTWFVDIKEPVLRAQDLAYLIGVPPVQVTTTTAGVMQDYAFQMLRAAPTPPSALESLTLRVHAKGGMIRRIEAPENFLLMFSRRVLEETLRQAKDAEVLELKKTARVHIRLSPEADGELPTLERTERLLGRPLERTEKDGLVTLTYRYRTLGDMKDIAIIARLSFSSDGALRRAVIGWDTATVDAAFLRR